MTMQQALDDAVANAFAGMAFMDAVRDSDPARLLQNCHSVCVDVERPVLGSIMIRLSAGVRKRLVENVYGTSLDALPRTAADDCVRELANIVTGMLARGLSVTGGEVRVSLPRIVYHIEEDELASWKRHQFQVDGMPAEVLVESSV